MAVDKQALQLCGVVAQLDLDQRVLLRIEKITERSVDLLHARADGNRECGRRRTRRRWIQMQPHLRHFCLQVCNLRLQQWSIGGVVRREQLPRRCGVLAQKHIILLLQCMAFKFSRRE